MSRRNRYQHLLPTIYATNSRYGCNPYCNQSSTETSVEVANLVWDTCLSGDLSYWSVTLSCGAILSDLGRLRGGSRVLGQGVGQRSRHSHARTNELVIVHLLAEKHHRGGHDHHAPTAFIRTAVGNSIISNNHNNHNNNTNSNNNNSNNINNTSTSGICNDINNSIRIGARRSTSSNSSIGNTANSITSIGIGISGNNNNNNDANIYNNIENLWVY